MPADAGVHAELSGADPDLLARLSDAAGVEIWSNTGLYGAADHKFVPAFARSESSRQLARRWIAETREAWRPRFIKTGVNRGPLDEIDGKLVRAAAFTSRETGLTIASHTGDGAAAVEQLEIVTAERVSPEKFVWVHAQNERDHSLHERVARAGAWVEFDGIGPKTAEFHLECVRFMTAKGLLNRTLVSQDAGWYHVGEPGGGEFRGYAYLYTDFLPRLEPAEVAKTDVGEPARGVWGTELSRPLRVESPHTTRAPTSGLPPTRAAALQDMTNRPPSLQGPVSFTRFGLKLRPVLHLDPDGMKVPWLASLRFEAENVLAMHLFAHQLNSLLQSVLLQETQGSPARDLRE
ncbi:MAG: hypothetical protein DMG57_40595 [Acidobacteria bacterium]|nr:MAG: hypothetical protein DMG57_40595 [Acidobacteriota bacterium]